MKFGKASKVHNFTYIIILHNFKKKANYFAYFIIINPIFNSKVFSINNNLLFTRKKIQTQFLTKYKPKFIINQHNHKFKIENLRIDAKQK